LVITMVRKSAISWSPWFLALSALGMLGIPNAAATETCPFCSAASQTLRQESLSMDAVAIGHLVSDGRIDIDGNATFEIEQILRGNSLLEVGQTVEVVYFGPGKSDKKFLLLGVDPRNLSWSSPLPLSAEAVRYVEAIQSLPDDPVARLDFYQKHFEHADSLLARDSYDEFALAPYEDVKKLKDKMDRNRLLGWVRDPLKSPDRKRLYYTMLGICGLPEDADEFEDMIESSDPEKRAGLDALIAAYLMIKGSDGLKLIDEQFLANRKASYPDVYSAVMALRFHGTEVEVLPKKEILKSMSHLLDAPDLADLVIPDLARWGDWSQIDRLTELFKNANEDNSWVRVPVVNYLRACPLPEAKGKLEELEKIDPKAVKRAATFFPIPAPAPKPKQNDRSSWSPLVPLGQPALGQLAQSAEGRLAITNQIHWGWQLTDGAGLVSESNPMKLSEFATPSEVRMNSFLGCSVLILASMMLGSLMWMVAAGMFSRELAFLQLICHGYVNFRRG
jgi:ribosomal protein L24E